MCGLLGFSFMGSNWLPKPRKTLEFCLQHCIPYCMIHIMQSRMGWTCMAWRPAPSHWVDRFLWWRSLIPLLSLALIIRFLSFPFFFESVFSTIGIAPIQHSKPSRPDLNFWRHVHILKDNNKNKSLQRTLSSLSGLSEYMAILVNH